MQYDRWYIISNELENQTAQLKSFLSDITNSKSDPSKEDKRIFFDLFADNPIDECIHEEELLSETAVTGDSGSPEPMAQAPRQDEPNASAEPRNFS